MRQDIYYGTSVGILRLRSSQPQQSSYLNSKRLSMGEGGIYYEVRYVSELRKKALQGRSRNKSRA